MDLFLFLFSHLFFLKFANSVILSGQPYCIDHGIPVAYAVPDDVISLTCVVDSLDGRANILTWMIPSFGVQVFNNFGANDGDNDQPEFQSVVNDFNNTAATTNATLSFPAVKGLDGAVVSCRDNNNPVELSSCTLFILTPPTAPSSFICTNVTNDSLILQWGEPTDNGGEVLQYNITGTPGDINIVESGNNVTIDNLLLNGKYNLIPNITYNFSIIAGNTAGFGNQISVECTTDENRPSVFMEVDVCLDISNSVYPENDAELIVVYSPCPLVTDEFTPAVTSYRVVVGGSDIPAKDSSSCDFNEDISTDDMSELTVDVYASNSVGSTKTSYRNGAVFHASWIRDINVTDVSGSSAVIQYTTADCVLSTDLIVELITPNSSMVDGDTTHDYENETTSTFLLTSLTPNDVVTFTLQVTVDSTTVYNTTSSLTAVPTTTTTTIIGIPTDTTNTMPTSSTTTSINITTTTTFTPIPTSLSSDTNILVIGTVCITTSTLLIAVIILTMIILYLKKRNNHKSSVDLLSSKEGLSDDPIPLYESKRSLPETGQALYQEIDAIKWQPAPTGDVCALPDKPRRQPPPLDPSPVNETPTYQDPNTIQRQPAPTGDMYALPQKKPQRPKDCKSSGTVYADVEFEDDSKPPSPPQNDARVQYTDIKVQ